MLNLFKNILDDVVGDIENFSHKEKLLIFFTFGFDHNEALSPNPYLLDFLEILKLVNIDKATELLTMRDKRFVVILLILFFFIIDIIEKFFPN